MKKNAFLQISFGWLFALVVGAFILFLAVFMVVRLMQTEEVSQDAQLAKDIGILLQPLETGFETGKTTFLELATETRIYTNCSESDNDSYFGEQIIRTSQQSFGKWSNTDVEVAFQNKYIFSDNPVEGKKFYLFSKPFEFPFKVSDLIYVISAEKDYCFVGAGEEINEELSRINMKNVMNKTSISLCPLESEKICFNSFSSTCDTKVKTTGVKSVKRINSSTVYFEEDALMYAAIFSNRNLYECQVRRLMKRVESLASLYDKKSILIRPKNCNSGINLLPLITHANNLDESNKLEVMAPIVNQIKQQNDFEYCKLW